MIALDASVMIAVLDPQDAHFDAARQIFVGNASHRLIAHRLNLAEALVLATRRNTGGEAASALIALGVVASDRLDDAEQLAGLRVNTSLPMPDCCLLHLALRERAGIATFDRRLAAAARAVGVAVVGAE
ncbi:MAG TPA: type II toxin-antitoxin system VapC family toxin [Protaetiibacter sp.]|nr:type II toxin-antitoxin system VapC family toxin [Protaetiibacter sp.]